mmetsp:Transcript_33094/g.86948  ORF Transcript_33094/g.86948 Transcript_33094/m.86948 type:complete len:230 (-) Transcript_33094:533-1222(-)
MDAPTSNSAGGHTLAMLRDTGIRAAMPTERASRNAAYRAYDRRFARSNLKRCILSSVGRYFNHGSWTDPRTTPARKLMRDAISSMGAFGSGSAVRAAFGPPTPRVHQAQGPSRWAPGLAGAPWRCRHPRRRPVVNHRQCFGLPPRRGLALVSLALQTLSSSSLHGIRLPKGTSGRRLVRTGYAWLWTGGRASWAGESINFPPESATWATLMPVSVLALAHSGMQTARRS